MAEDVFHLGVKALIRDHEGNILLAQVNPKMLKGKSKAPKSYWDLPGGRVQVGETIQAALQREAQEETGIAEIGNVAPLGMVLSNIRIPLDNDQSVGLILSIFQCTIPSSDNIRLSREHVSYDWLAPSQAAKLLAVKYPPEFCEIISNI